MSVDVKANLRNFRASLTEEGITLVAISKTKPTELIQAAYDEGQRDFGENKAQEMAAKYESLPKDIRWHFVGHLQRNKVKYLAPFVHLIHSVDSKKLLKEINKEAAKNDRIIDCLVQVHIAEEDTKFGFDEAEIKDLLSAEVFAELPNVRVKGLMGMATFTDDQSQVRREFQRLKQLFDQIANSYSDQERISMEVLSMGMSGDYQIALDEGSTMIRIGTTIFGERN